MKAKSLNELWDELLAAERFGTSAVRGTGCEALENWGGECGPLSDLAGMFRELAERACSRDDTDLYAAWLFLADLAWDCARANLSPGDFHTFCDLQAKQEKRSWRHFEEELNERKTPK